MNGQNVGERHAIGCGCGSGLGCGLAFNFGGGLGGQLVRICWRRWGSGSDHLPTFPLRLVLGIETAVRAALAHNNTVKAAGCELVTELASSLSHNTSSHNVGSAALHSRVWVDTNPAACAGTVARRTLGAGDEPWRQYTSKWPVKGRRTRDVGVGEDEGSMLERWVEERVQLGIRATNVCPQVVLV